MDNTDKLLAKFQRRMANAERIYAQAAAKLERANEIERQLSLPDHERPSGDETTLTLEAKLLRQEADDLTRDANGIQERLHQPPSVELTEAVEDWAKRRTDERER